MNDLKIDFFYNLKTKIFKDLNPQSSQISEIIIILQTVHEDIERPISDHTDITVTVPQAAVRGSSC